MANTSGGQSNPASVVAGAVVRSAANAAACL
jgi:hypothetical protein